MDHDGVHPNVLEKDDVAGEALPQRGVLHRRAAVLDDDDAPVELADVRQRLEQRPDGARHVRTSGSVVAVAHVVYSALMRMYSCPKSLKKTSVSWPSPGRPMTYSTSSALTFCASASSS